MRGREQPERTDDRDPLPATASTSAITPALLGVTLSESCCVSASSLRSVASVTALLPFLFLFFSVVVDLIRRSCAPDSLLSHRE
jgi:hypothetical protein